MENVKDWLDKKGYYNSGLRTDRNHRIDLYLSDVLDEYRTEELSKTNVISCLLAMKNSEDLPDFDHSKASDTAYCVEWGIKKGRWITDGIIDRYIDELNGL